MQLPTLEGQPVTCSHVCYLTPDLDQTIATFAAVGAKGLERVEFSLGVYAFAELPASPETDIAGSGIMVELIEPTVEGTLFSDHLARHGPGLHHIGLTVHEFDRALEGFVASGCVITLEHRTPDFSMCYLDCTAIGFPAIEMLAT